MKSEFTTKVITISAESINAFFRTGASLENDEQRQSFFYSFLDEAIQQDADIFITYYNDAVGAEIKVKTNKQEAGNALSKVLPKEKQEGWDICAFSTPHEVKIEILADDGRQ